MPLGLAAAVLLVLSVSEARAAPDGETQFVLNSFAFLIWGALVMWMCAGFTMLESGSVRTKNASVICLKNIGLYSIAGLMYYFIGYNIMYVGVEAGGWFGSLEFLFGTSPAEVALLGGGDGAAVVETGHAAMSGWFFQMVFVATTRLDRLGHPGRADQAVVVLRLHRGADGDHLSGHRLLDMGRRMARRNGLQGFRRVDHRPLDRRLGGARRGARPRRAQGQVPRPTAASS